MKGTSVDYGGRGDAGIEPQDGGLEVVVVSDGQLSDASLRLFGKDGNWVEKTLKKEKTALDEVFILTVNDTGKYTLVKKGKGSEKEASA